MEANFDRCLSLVLASEGGYVNSPHDLGGATCKGVTQRVYDSYRRNRGQACQTVRVITPAEVSDIYRVQFWNAVDGDQLPPGVDYAVFDPAVNSGVATGAKWLQRAVGVAQDGHIGQITLAAVAKADPKVVINAICDRRLSFLEALHNWRYFGRGWKNRVAFVRANALAMVK